MSLNRWKSTLVRTWFLALVSVCFGATCVVSGQVEIGPRSKTPPKKFPDRPAKRPAEKPKYKLYEAPDSTSNVVDLGGGVRLEMVTLEPGSFWMGSDSGDQPDERPVHRVTITRSFGIGKYEVTQGQWKAVMETNPSKFTGNDDLPVETVSWDDCQEFIRRLNVKTGMKFRLPTEAEWEYACRAGTTGDWAGNLDSMGWYYENAGRSRLSDSSWDLQIAVSNGNQTHPVGQKQPNGWGLYDMHGNVWEWCQDWYDENYYGRSQGTDPAGPTRGTLRVFRGGGWYIFAIVCRSASRGPREPAYSSSTIGLRLARTQ